MHHRKSLKDQQALAPRRFKRDAAALMSRHRPAHPNTDSLPSLRRHFRAGSAAHSSHTRSRRCSPARSTADSSTFRHRLRCWGAIRRDSGTPPLRLRSVMPLEGSKSPSVLMSDGQYPRRPARRAGPGHCTGLRRCTGPGRCTGQTRCTDLYPSTDPSRPVRLVPRHRSRAGRHIRTARRRTCSAFAGAGRPAPRPAGGGSRSRRRSRRRRRACAPRRGGA
jgi:hypothetical protein